MKKDLRDYLKILISRRDLSETEAAGFFCALQNETENESLLAAVLTAFETKGATEIEIFAMANFMRESCRKIFTTRQNFVDLVGTGGSAVKTFNVSTAAAFVIAGANTAVAKHGNRAATSQTGSADVLAELGVNIAVKSEIAEKCLNNSGICFLFAPEYHALSPVLAKVRRAMGVPTIFNVLGPICNPANAPHQVIGVYRKDLVGKTARVLARFDAKKTWVVFGEDGLDEITTGGKTFAAEIENGTVKEFEISPADFGIKINSISNMQKFSAAESADFIKSFLRNETVSEEAQNLILINAAAAIFVSGNASDLKEAFQKAEKSLLSGSALNKLNELIEFTN